MIDKLDVLDLIDHSLKGTDKFLVEMKILPENRIYVSIDGDEGITIDDCVDLSRAIENGLDRDVEDFELNVASAGLDSPLKLPRQYRKNIGQPLSVVTFEGDRYEGVLKDADDEQATLTVNKTKRTPAHDRTFRYLDIKEARLIIKF
ncbi:MAG: ribosome assembly cofactor RimP [Bacteroidales bacterium]|nr:ribosome assembly cofactor RimP [Bacteroidales bacterium]